MNRVARSGLLLLLAAVAFLSSCRREAPSNIDRNKAPQTYITKAPAESSLTYYRAHFFWEGADPDGQVSFFELAVTDSNEVPGQNLEEGTGYTRTLSTDSLFVLKADPPIEQQIAGKRLYVRAVDNEGKLDPSPAVAYFVAKNDFYPQVTFEPGEGQWVDQCGTTHTTVLTSTNAFEPTDTVGVGGSVTWNWTGFDNDPEGSVAGFVFKLSSQPTFKGGGPDDRQASFTFPRNAGRRQILQVRAIDDGGLRSDSDFTASVVVNFDPITRVVLPPSLGTNPDGSPIQEAVFLEDTQVWPSGTTLADGSHRVTVFYSGLDDARDTKPNCGDVGITRYESRRLFRNNSNETPGGPPWGPIGGLQAWPSVNEQEIFGLGSGDHLLMFRARDDLLVFDSTPETVLVKVNYTPYLTSFKVRPESAPESANIELLRVDPTDASTIIRLVPGERLLVTLLGSDYHKVDPAPSGGGSRDSLAALFDLNDVVQDETTTGLNVLEAYRAYVQGASIPGFDPVPEGDESIAYRTRLEVPASGVITLRADVRDRTNFNPATGRVGRYERRVTIQTQE